MRVGLLADTHDRLPAIRELLRKMTEGGATLVMHAGDYCSPFSLEPVHEAQLPMLGVFGHNDGDREALRALAQQGMATELYESPHSFDVGGKRILVVHDLREVSPRSVEEHAIVITGHTHQPLNETRGDTLIVNPGEACGWLHGTPTAAIIDLETREVEVIRLDGPEWQR